MNDRLVFDLVWEFGIHSFYLQEKKNHADALHKIVCTTIPSDVREKNLGAMMGVLKFLAEEILGKYGLAPRASQRVVADEYYSLTIRALDLIRITIV